MSIQNWFIAVALLLIIGPLGAASAQGAEQDQDASGRLVLRGGTVIDVRDGTLRPNMVVMMEGDRITAVTSDPVAAEPGDRSLDVTGQYVIPGLIDAHLHYEDFAAELLLNHGVTSVLDLGNDYEWIKAQAEGIRAGWIPGPRLYFSTPHFDAPPPAGSPLLLQRGHKHFVDDVQTAGEATARYITDGVSSVKIYEQLKPEVLAEIARVAEEANVPVIGHFRDSEITAAVGGAGIEHLRAVAASVQDPELVEQVRELNAGRPGSLGLTTVASVDWDRLPGVIDMLVEKNVYLNPTLMGYRSVPHFKEKGFQYEDFELLLNDWRLRYIPLQYRLHILKEYQEQGVWHWDDLDEHEQQWAINQFENALRMT